MRRLLPIAALLLLASPAAHAASVRVSPILLDVRAPGRATALTLRNEDVTPLNVQVRVFRWSQSKGAEQLEPTNDVVVSPPFTTLPHGSEYVVRVVRVTPRPLAAEESYRVIVDELPDQPATRGGIIRLLMRYSIPVFFSAPQASEPRIAWSLERRDGQIVVWARNSGGKRLQISNLQLRDARGVTVSLRDGLVGYVLGGGAARWAFPGAQIGKLSGDTVKLTANTDSGPIDATIKIGPSR